MAPLTYLDTHVLAWLFGGELHRIPAAAREKIESSDLLASPMALVELQYLFEIGRLVRPASEVFERLSRDLGLEVCDLPFFDVARHGFDMDFTRDLFDRLIVSQAAVREAPLLTKDETIHEFYPHACWK